MSLLFESYSQKLRASFVYPTIGHYCTYASDIPGETRTSEWERWYVGEGQVPVQLWTWEKKGNMASTRQLTDFNFPEEQPEFNWITLYRESSTPQVEPVATCMAAPSNKINKAKRTWHQRSQTEMQHAFDVDRMTCTEEPQSARQQKQKRQYIGDSTNRILTTKPLEARCRIHFGSSINCIVPPHACM